MAFNRRFNLQFIDDYDGKQESRGSRASSQGSLSPLGSQQIPVGVFKKDRSRFRDFLGRYKDKFPTPRSGRDGTSHLAESLAFLPEDLLSHVSSYLEGHPVFVTLVGSSGLGKRFLINALLQATCIPYKKASSSAADPTRIPKPRVPAPPDDVIIHMTNSLRAEFAQAIDWRAETEANSAISKAMYTSLYGGADRKQIDDERCFLLPQGVFGSLVPRLRYGEVPEVIVTFPTQRSLRKSLWRLHEVYQSGDVSSREFDALRQRYAAVLGIHVSSAPLLEYQSPAMLPIPKKVMSVLGKTVRWCGVGINLDADRVFIRTKMRELSFGLGWFAVSCIVRFPCTLLECNIELTIADSNSSGYDDVCNARVLQAIQKSNLLLVAVDSSGLPQCTRTMLENADWPRLVREMPEQRKALLVELQEKRNGQEAHAMTYRPNRTVLSQFNDLLNSNNSSTMSVSQDVFSSASPSYPDPSSVPARSQTGRSHLRPPAQSISPLPPQNSAQKEPANHLAAREATSGIDVLGLRPLLFLSLFLSQRNVPQASHSSIGDPSAALRAASNVPALVGCIQNMALARCAEPLRDFTRLWMRSPAYQQQVHVVHPMLSTPNSSTSSVTSGSSSRSSSSGSGNSGCSGGSSSIVSPEMSVLAQSFRDKLHNFKRELQLSARSIDLLLQREAQACSRVTQQQCLRGGRRVPSPEIKNMTCGRLLSGAPTMWQSVVVDKLPEKMEEILSISVDLLNECTKVLEVREGTQSNEKDRLLRLLEYCRRDNERTIRERMQNIKREAEADTGRLVNSACDSALQGNGVNQQQTLHLPLDSLPKVPVDAARNIQEKFAGLLGRCTQQLDMLEKDMQYSVRHMYRIRSRLVPVPSSGALEVNDDHMTVDSSGAQSPVVQYHIQRKAPTAKPITDYAPFNLGSVARVFGAAPWNVGAFGSQGRSAFRRYQEQLQSGSLEPCEVRTDGNAQLRAFAHQVYGTEEAHSVVRLLVMHELLSNSAVYTRYLGRRNLQTYVADMAKDGVAGDHITIAAFCNVYGIDLLIFSPLFPKPLRVTPRQTVESQYSFAISYVNANHYQSLTPCGSNSAEAMDTTTASAGASSTTTDSSSPSTSTTSNLDRNARRSKQPRTSVVPQRRAKNKGPHVLSLTQLCVNAMVDEISTEQDVPPLESVLPSELVQKLVTESIRQAKATTSMLTRILDPFLYSLKLDHCNQLNDKSCAVVAERCPRLRRLSLASCGNITSMGVAEIARHCANLELLNLENCRAVDDVAIQEIARCCAKLHTINLAGCVKITNSALEYLTRSCAHLRTMNLKNCGRITDGKLFPRGVRDLDLSECRQLTDDAVTDIAKRSQVLQTLKLSGNNITDASLHHVADLCSNLRNLELQGCEGVSDATVHDLAKSCPQLNTLSLASCKNITSEAFLAEHIGGGRLADLQHLDLTRCHNLADDALTSIAKFFPRLSTLNLMSCEAITDVGLMAIARGCVDLTEIVLDKCSHITDTAVVEVTTRCRRLRSLRLHSCNITDETLRHVALNCQASLEELDLSCCDKITDDGMRQIGKTLSNLLFLSVEELTNLTDVGVGALAESCSKLTTLKLGYCSKVKDASLLRVAQACSSLRVVDLSFCNGLSMEGITQCLALWDNLQILYLRGYNHLTTEGMTHGNLSVLNLSWCKHLENNGLAAIGSGCPKLENIDIAWCSRITDTAIAMIAKQCASLRVLNLRNCNRISPLTVRHLATTGVMVYK